MFPRFLVTGLICILFCSCVSAQKGSRRVIAAAFYNFENLFDTVDDPGNRGDDDFLPRGIYRYTEAIYNQKLRNIASVLQQLGASLVPDGPALIGTAEVENDRVLADLCRRPEIRDRNYRFVHFDSRDSRGIDVALLYHPGYFTLLYARAVLVDISSFGEKGGRTRDILYASGVLAGDTVHVLVNHWPSRRGGEAASAPLRAVAAATAKRLIDSLTEASPGSRIILMGDLNDDPVSASVAKVLGAKSSREEVTSSGLYNPWVSFYRKGIGTLAYNDAWGLFDQIIISGALLRGEGGHLTYHKAEVFNREFLKNSFGLYKGYPHRSFDGTVWINGYSDHFPTVIYLAKEE